MNAIFNHWKVFKQLLRSSFKDLIPIVVVILIFQIGIFEIIPDNWQRTVVGLIIVGFGLALFLQGLELGIFPVGESLAIQFSKSSSRLLLLSFAFLIGYGTTVAEPALSVVAKQAMQISNGRVDSFVLRQVVAFSAGFAVALGVLRIILGHPIYYYIISGYILVLVVTIFTPQEMIALAYDLGGVTTSTVTVPLVAALGIGLANGIKGRNPVIDGFGLIAFAALTPMIFVQFYGIYAYNFAEVQEVVQTITAAEQQQAFELTASSLLYGLGGSFVDIFPVLAVVLFFHYIILRQAVANISRVLFGFVLTVLGLYAFVIGLEMGLFSLGESMALQLTKTNNVALIYLFAAAIGISTTMAEPSLIAIAQKACEISGGKINDYVLRIFVAIGVAFGIAIGCYRIVAGDLVQYYILVGYIFVIILTFLAPKYIIPIAYDSGGVTTSTVTVPLVAALGLGLSSTIPGRNPLIDGFGLIAFASLFPMITVLLYGIVVDKFNLSTDSKDTIDKGVATSPDTVAQAQLKEMAPTHGKQSDRIKSTSEFEAVIAIMEEGEVDNVLVAARNLGASGVTIMNANGLGLDQFSNFYRYIKQLDRKFLLFIVPRAIASDLVETINQQLHTNADTRVGIVMSLDITALKGLGIQQEILSQLKV